MVFGREAEWIIRLGPFVRTNLGNTRKQAEEGAMQQVLDDGAEIMEKAKVLIPLLLKGAVCAGGSEPGIKEEFVEPKAYTYQVSDERWFSIATSGNFGIKAVCRD